MAAAAETLTKTSEQYRSIPIDERLLTEIDHLAAHRLEGGSYPDKVLDDMLVNLKTAAQEGGIPHAISTTEHEYTPTGDRRGVFTWMGKTAVQNAMSGYGFHIDPEAIKRVDVEVDEAHHAQEELRPGVVKIFISPKMSRKDATLKVAKKEHLADDDAVRMSWLETDENGVIQKRIMQSLLLKDVPLEAWVAMLQDPDNIFGKAIAIEDPESALSVMQVHRELELPIGSLKDGIVDIIRAVVPYITDPEEQAKVVHQIEKFNTDQVELDKQAEYIAQQWLKFEVELDKSFKHGVATFEIERFLVGLQSKWKETDAEIISNHLTDDGYVMTRSLAKILEKAKRNTLWATAAVMSGNEAVLDQLEPAVAQQINTNAGLMYAAQQSGFDIRMYEAENNRLIASQNVDVGGGCSGTTSDAFGNNVNNNENGGTNENSTSPTKLVWKSGVCRIKACPTRPGTTEVAQCSVCRGCQDKFDKGQDPSK